MVVTRRISSGMTSCSEIEVYQCFRGHCNYQQSQSFDSEVGGSTLLQNANKPLPDYSVSHP